MLDKRDGHRCAWTGEESDRLVPQHRAGGMGGSPSKHRASNVVWLDSIRNGLIESDPELQAEALRRGIKVSKFADTTEVPILHAVHGLVRLNDEGGWEPVEEPDLFAGWSKP
ncbi:hypothetical protein Q9R08_05065 [Microbacterium sp. QXD-8]|uniref:HNH endonuclease n=1 Tax=Microbacterium psychrotolerans TaxID=3068321 RepID=A0ABU0YYD5_9MICO|nr:hypothetical protein [Microbacterium sp. QXD-8]MDQ7877343.1 hypothetical protein [Microbacterium sp. QXD-8]